MNIDNKEAQQLPIMYGWYSKQQLANTNHTFIYTLPDSDVQVSVTHIADSATDHGTLYDDIYLIGPIDKFISSVQHANRFIDREPSHLENKSKMEWYED